MSEPEKQELWQDWLDEFQNESDRACALLGAAFLDEHLGALLEAFFANVEQKVKEDLFEHANAPLKSFSSKINISYALGFVAPSEARDLHLIRKIRNDFGHKLQGLSFSSQEVASRCAELTACDKVGRLSGTFDPQSFLPRDRFVWSVVFLAHWIALRRLGIGNQRRTIRSEVTVSSGS